MMLTLLFGIYRAMYADATMWEVAKTLFSFTINPGIEFFNELEVRQSELLTGGVSHIHLLPLSLIVPLPPLLHTHHHHTYPRTPTQAMVVRTPPPFPTYPKPLGCIDALIPAASLSQLPILTNVLQVVWIMLGNVVLLNVIIAMMNSTYGQATHTSTIPVGDGIGLLPFFVVFTLSNSGSPAGVRSAGGPVASAVSAASFIPGGDAAVLHPALPRREGDRSTWTPHQVDARDDFSRRRQEHSRMLLPADDQGT